MYIYLCCRLLRHSAFPCSTRAALYICTQPPLSRCSCPPHGASFLDNPLTDRQRERRGSLNLLLQLLLFSRAQTCKQRSSEGLNIVQNSLKHKTDVN
ncbi:hypothetical protein GDO81_023831 [Engystomops pustulosus]|uniref:Secreted protein n=1 Tax=Engystomops pustulosus TaxID=76066 RepID=A0AAV6Z8N6_ENGPU|nr:hypothetical protein GDO81_023831 [Engystomops pustulosus]